MSKFGKENEMLLVDAIILKLVLGLFFAASTLITTTTK